MKDTPTQYEQELKCMKERLTRCLQLLKINHNDQISKTAFSLIGKTISDQPKKTPYGKWIVTLNAIAGSCIINQRIFSQSEIYDFLTVAVATSIKVRTKSIDEIIFRIYRDIMTNYDSSNDKLKIVYPKIIVDVIAILATGVDANSKKVPIYNVENYYQMRKSDVDTSTVTLPPIAASSTSATAASIKSIDEEGKEEEPVPKSQPIMGDYKEHHLNKDENAELLKGLSKITGRSKKDIQTSVTKLHKMDIHRIRDLCKNYNKLQKYSKLIMDNDQQKLKNALENDVGRKLSDYQLQHAANSIRKAKLYIENVLDGKFVPHGSYGINHTKHNLEYGYLIVGLMQPSRKRTAITTTTTTTTKGRI